MTPDVRRLLGLVSVALVVEMSLYSAITPLLPELAETFDFTKSGAGVLSAAYPVGTLVASLPAGLLAARLGPRRAIIVALGVIAVASLAFGLADQLPLLIAARAAQGFGGAAVWAAGLSWVTAVAPRERRVEALGTAIGAAIAGALGGPILGAAADAAGRATVFAAFTALPLVLIAVLARRAEPDTAPRPGGTALFADGQARAGILLIALPSSVFGAVNVLVPLRLDDLGAGAAAIAAVFLVAVVLESSLSPVAGRMADRAGALEPARRGLLLGAAGLAVLPLMGAPVTVGIAVVVATGCLGFLWAPAMSLLGAAADHHDLNPAFAYSLGNLAWGSGTALGGAGAGALAGATADAVPFVALAVALGAVSVGLGSTHLRLGG